MSYAVIKKSSYVLVNTPDMIIHNGTTQMTERLSNPDSEYLKTLKNHIKDYEGVVGYAPNQVYIGNMTPDELAATPKPWFDKNIEGAKRFGKFGEVMPQDEFYGLMKICDVFDLVLLENDYLSAIKAKLEEHKIFKGKVSELGEGEEISKIKDLVENKGAEGLYSNGELIGCVRKAHDIDENLNSEYILENIACKASGVLAAAHLLDGLDVPVEEIGYVIECSETAIGDMNQRGGGNMAKAIAEVVGLTAANGSDIRGFCAAPAHALLNAASLVKAETFKHVLIVAGGCTAKLGMNAKSHIGKEMPVMEDVLGGFALLISENDGINPIVRTDAVGRHTVGHGSSPQAVLEALVLNPLKSMDMKITDVNKYSPEMQTSEITAPAGAGDVPTQNYKMIGALAVKNGQLDRKELKEFITKHGYEGFAPTQGHIPSGVPICGHGNEKIVAGELDNYMIVGKGSLFLGRMTNLFDGVSMLVEKNPGAVSEEAGISKEEVKSMVADAMKDFATFLMKN